MNDNLETPVKPSDLPVGELKVPEGTETPETKDEGLETPSAEYVKRLRTEAADARLKLQRLNDYEARLFDLVAADVASKALRDPSDFTVNDRSAFLGEDGYPDRDAIAAAVNELVEAKPYLARVAGDVGQGARPEPEPTVSLGGLLRNAAR